MALLVIHVPYGDSDDGWYDDMMTEWWWWQDGDDGDIMMMVLMIRYIYGDSFSVSSRTLTWGAFYILKRIWVNSEVSSFAMGFEFWQRVLVMWLDKNV